MQFLTWIINQASSKLFIIHRTRTSRHHGKLFMFLDREQHIRDIGYEIVMLWRYFATISSLENPYRDHRLDTVERNIASLQIGFCIKAQQRIPKVIEIIEYVERSYNHPTNSNYSIILSWIDLKNDSSSSLRSREIIIGFPIYGCISFVYFFCFPS